MQGYNDDIDPNMQSMQPEEYFPPAGFEIRRANVQIYKANLKLLEMDEISFLAYPINGLF